MKTYILASFFRFNQGRNHLVHTAFAVICFMLIGLPPLFASSDEIRSIIEAHEEGLRKITSLDVVLTCEEQFPGAADYLNSGMIRWVRDLNHQRFDERVLIRRTKEECVEHFRQVEFGGTKGRMLDGWNPGLKLEVPLLPSNDSTPYWSIRGTIDEPNSKSLQRPHAELWVLFKIKIDRGLRNYFENESIVTEKLPDSGRLVGLRFVDKESGERVECFLDPQHGWLINRIDLFDDEGVYSSKRVLTYIEPKPGLFFPEKIEVSTRRGFDVRFSASAVSINEPVDVADLSLQFPEGCKVRDKTNGKIYIWGKGKPLLMFSSDNEFEAWEEKVLLESTSM